MTCHISAPLPCGPASCRLWFRVLLAALLALLPFGAAAAPAPATNRPPNVVLIFCDDLGYGDVGCYGAKGYATPHLDRLAREGMRFTDFYVPQAVCSASRAALLTGCYPNRVGILGALGPTSRIGLHANEWTLAEMLKERGYATAIYGKWHLGRPPEFLPPAHGFDEYFGLPYSNDMWPNHPTGGTNYPPLPLIEGSDVVRLMPNQSQLTTWYTERAVKFIDTHHERPFFLYLPHNMPHVPLFVSDKFKGTTPRGLYGDVIAELDWSVGQVLEALRRHGLEENTLVLFTSDNGPWLSYGDHAGSSGGFREGKGTAWEGGVRVPFIARWPGRIPRGTVCREPAMTIDVLPTVAGLTGGRLPEHPIDGRNLWPLLSGQRGAKSPHESLWFYWDNGLHAIRSGPWKLHFPHPYVQPNPPGNGGRPGRMLNPRTELALYHLGEDPAETRDLAADRPEVVAQLQVLANQARADLGDGLLRIRPTGARPPGRMTE